MRTVAPPPTGGEGGLGTLLLFLSHDVLRGGLTSPTCSTMFICVVSSKLAAHSSTAGLMYNTERREDSGCFLLSSTPQWAFNWWLLNWPKTVAPLVSSPSHLEEGPLLLL